MAQQARLLGCAGGVGHLARCVSNLAALADAAGERSDVTHCYSRSNGTDLIAGDFGSSAGECAFGISAILMGRKRGHH